MASFVLHSIEAVNYANGTFYKVMFEGGMVKAITFSETLAAKLKEHIGQQIDLEVTPPKKAGQDPTIAKVTQPFEWEPGKGGGGGKPLLTDEQFGKLIATFQAGFEAVAAAIRAREIAREAPRSQVETPPEARAISREETDESIHPRCDKNYEGRRCVLVQGHWGDHEWSRS